LPSVAIRVPRHDVALRLLERVGRPVVAPSANPSGSMSPTSAEHVRAGLGGKVAVILDAGPCPVGLESTILDCRSERPKLLRPGGLPRETIEECLGQAVESAADGKRPGIFYVPILDASKFNVASGMESLFLHEAIPGHHYQISLQQENDSLPKFRRFAGYGAYQEGWALYCESLGKELGLYTDPYQDMGALGDEMHRAIRLVVDVGMHTKGMTREEAIKYMMDNEAISEQGATAEIERYMALPGQALSYKIGALKIRELRTKYEKELGTKFSLAKFHDYLLKQGPMPLDVLESVMDAWAQESLLN